MRTKREKLWAVAIVLAALTQSVQCQVPTDDYSDQINNPAVLPYLTQVVYSRLSNLTSDILRSQMTNQSSFCVKDPEAEWDKAFNYSSNLDFLTSCIQKTNGDITRRLCTAAEMKFYFNSFFEGTNPLKPNKNCNLTAWIPGCEPGWACSSGSNQEVDLKNSRDIPARTLECQPCCEGFFCPRGLTCMIYIITNSLLQNLIILVVEQTFGQTFALVGSYSVHQDHTVQLVHNRFHAAVGITVVWVLHQKNHASS